MRSSAPSALIPKRVPRLDEMLAWDGSQVSLATGLSQTFVKELTKQGKFKAAKIGKRTLYDPRQIRRALFGGEET